MPLLTHYSPHDFRPLMLRYWVTWCGAWTTRPARIVSSSTLDAVTCRRCRKKLNKST